jgi:hypothetical protein
VVSGITADQTTGVTDANGNFVIEAAALPEAKQRQVIVKVDNASGSVTL